MSDSSLRAQSAHQERLLSVVLELIPYAVFWKDRESRYYGCNAVFARIAGLASPADIVGLTDFDLPWSREETEAYRADDRHVIESERAKIHIIEPQLNAQGERTWLDTSKVPLRDGQGRVIGVLGIFADITAQKENEQQLVETRGYLEAAIEAIESGLVLYGADERLVFCNERYRELYGDARDSVVPGRPYREILEEYVARAGLPEAEGREFVERRLAQHRACSGDWVHELEGRTIRISDRRTTDGGTVSLRTDITALKQIERELRIAKEEAEAANLAKSNFLANMSHEIRTPMTAILGFTDVLLAEISEPSHRSALETIRRNGESLLGLINDILDLSKVEAGMVEAELEWCAVDELLGEVVELMQLRARSKGITLGVRYDAQFPRRVRTDMTRARQVLVNLVSNAVKFTEVGGVTLVPRWRERDGRGQLEVAVEDTGIGLTEEQQARIFKPFEQADASTTRKYGGTGLGLSISLRLAELLGGTIDVESRPGVGSTFRFRLDAGEGAGRDLCAPECDADRSASHAPGGRPAASAGQVRPASAAPQPVVPVGALSGCRILLAEDGPDNQYLLSHVLRKAGAQVVVAANGRLALAAVEEDPEGFDLVLMDMQMPELDGYDASRMLRAGGNDLPIVALTAHAMEGDRQECLAAGCSDYLSKPVPFHVLVETCRRWVA